MKTRYLFLLPMAVLFGSCASRTTIVADIEGLGRVPVIVGSWDINTPLRSNADVTTDTIAVSSGRFVHRIDAKGPTQVRIFPLPIINGMFPESTSINLLLQPGEKVRLTGRITDNKYIEYSVKGSPVNERWARYAETLRPYTLAADSIGTEIRKTAVVNPFRNPMDFKPVLDSIFDGIDSLKREFIVANPDSWISAVYIVEGAAFGENKAYIDRLSPEVREGFLKPILDRLYEL